MWDRHFKHFHYRDVPLPESACTVRRTASELLSKLKVKCHVSCKVLLIWLQYVEFRVNIVFSLVELVRSNVGCFVSLFIETYIRQQRNSITMNIFTITITPSITVEQGRETTIIMWQEIRSYKLPPLHGTSFPPLKLRTLT